jgi:type IV pilus assembly protein PilY1
MTMKPSGRKIVRGVRSLRRPLLGFAAAWVLGCASAQTISDIPIAVKNNVPPNLMFMLDNSGSMSNIVPSAPYQPPPHGSYTESCFSPAPTDRTITIRILGGVPHFRYNNTGTEYVHTSFTYGATPRRCFDNSATYMAALLGDNAGTYGSSYLPSEYTGHYLNWYFGAFGGPVNLWSDRKRVTTGVVQTRMEIARIAARSVIDGLPLVISGTTNPAVRVGLSTYNSGNGGTLVQAMGNFDAAKRTAMNASIAGIAAGGNTPLAETLADIGRYMSTGYTGNVTTPTVAPVNIDTFFRQDGRNSCLAGTSCAGNDAVPSPPVGTPGRPIQYWCQKSYVFLMTDGRPQGDQAFTNNAYLRDYDGDCAGNPLCQGGYDRKTTRSYESQGSDYLDDIAKALNDVDLRPNLVAPAGRAKKNNLLTYPIGFADLQVQDDPLLTTTAQQGGGRYLSAQDGPTLTTAFKNAMTDAFSKDAAAAAVAVANAQITVSNIGYASSYNSGTWYGDLHAYAVDTTTGLQTGAASWSARDKLNAQDPSARKIVSFDGTLGRPFTRVHFEGTPAALTAGVIDYLRGHRTGEGDPYRTRMHVLGDIVNAEPVVGIYGGAPVVFQAANDGMLHVFDGQISSSAATRGQELWAYVPRLIHSNLDQLASPAYSHRFYVDATPALADIDGAGAMTRILVGGLGKGGAGYYALDVTTATAADEDAAAAKVKWEFTDPNMGYSFGTPLIVKTAAGWRVIVASGYGNGAAGFGGDGKGYVWVLDPSDGRVVATMRTNVGSAADPSGLAHLAKLAHASPSAVVRHVYGGDLRGNVWRFDLDTFTVTRIAILADGGGNFQPVTAAPEVGPVTGNSSKFFVYVGTGRYLSDEDIPGTSPENAWARQQQTMYGIVDDTTVATPALPNIRGTNGSSCPAEGGDGEFVCQSMSLDADTGRYVATAHAVPLAAKRGWYVDLPVTHGRVTGKPGLTTGGTLAFVANIPSSVRCDPGGSSWFFQVSASGGGGISKVVGGAEVYDSGFFLGDALGSRPTLIQTAGGKRALIRMSNVETNSKGIDETANLAAAWKRVYWRKLGP